MATDTDRRPKVPALVTILGGGLMIAGSLLPFLTIEGGTTGIAAQNVGGLDTDDGKIFLGVGIGLLVIGLAISLTTGVLPKVLGAVAFLAGGFMTYAGIVDVSGVGEEGLQKMAEAVAPSVPGVTVEQIRELLRQAGVTVGAGIGLFVALAGAVVGAVGGLMALFTRTTRPAEAPAFTEPSPAGPPPAVQEPPSEPV